MKTIGLPLLLLCSFAGQAQYYYNDLLNARDINQQYALYRAQKVSTVSATGVDPRGSRSTDFSEYHELRENGRVLRSTTIGQLAKNVITKRFNEKGLVSSITDSTNGIVTITTYQYDDNNLIVRMENRAADTSTDFNQVETHYWIYQENNQPSKMWRVIRSGKDPAAPADSLEIRFLLDENGRPSEEKTFRRGVETGFLYYYYDEEDRLTDIVRYNTKAKKLLPDVLFEYDEQNRVIQKITTTTAGNLGYLIWRYIYDEKGLKTKEALFNKDKQLTGKIEYSYTFGS